MMGFTAARLSSRPPKMKMPAPPAPAPKPVPIAMVLARLDKICKEEGHWAKANLYVSALGVILEFQAVSRLLTNENLKALEQLRMVIFGDLYVGPILVAGKASNGTETKVQMVEVTIRTSRAVEVIPIPRQAT